MSTIFAERPRFFEGQYLGADDLDTFLKYAREHDARHLLGAHTWGIVAGIEAREQHLACGRRGVLSHARHRSGRLRAPDRRHRVLQADHRSLRPATLGHCGCVDPPRRVALQRHASGLPSMRMQRCLCPCGRVLRGGGRAAQHRRRTRKRHRLGGRHLYRCARSPRVPIGEPAARLRRLGRSPDLPR